jgi:hypothetical protein
MNDQTVSFTKTYTGLTEDYLRNQIFPKIFQIHQAQLERGIGSFLPGAIKPSIIYETGLFTTRDLKKGEVFL